MQLYRYVKTVFLYYKTKMSKTWIWFEVWKMKIENFKSWFSQKSLLFPISLNTQLILTLFITIFIPPYQKQKTKTNSPLISIS